MTSMHHEDRVSINTLYHSPVGDSLMGAQGISMRGHNHCGLHQPGPNKNFNVLKKLLVLSTDTSTKVHRQCFSIVLFSPEGFSQ